MDITKLGLKLRSFRGLCRGQINTTKQLTRMTPTEVLSINKMGRVSLRDIELCLNKQGLRLRGEDAMQQQTFGHLPHFHTDC